MLKLLHKQIHSIRNSEESILFRRRRNLKFPRISETEVASIRISEGSIILKAKKEREEI